MEDIDEDGDAWITFSSVTGASVTTQNGGAPFCVARYDFGKLKQARPSMECTRCLFISSI